MSLERYEYELLKYLEKNGCVESSLRTFCDELCISASTLAGCIEKLEDKGCVRNDGSILGITDEGRYALEPYRVRKAVIFAAGFGSRMMPATADRPKPMVTVNGVRIIDTLLDALTDAEITDITIIGGYKFEKLTELKQKYPFLKLIENKEYAQTNNISSAVLSLPELSGGCYICEADLFISDPEVISKYQYRSNILGSYSMETDDWSFRMEDGFLTDYKKGNTYCYNYYGISYWTAGDCEKLKEDFRSIYDSPDGKNYFWEFIPFVLKKEKYKVEIRPCRKQDIMEIDNYFELAQLDPSYRSKEE
ncbi:MAG: NTP transferase domain-containing protein [Firmicutes bacterium]|nr:NTP transferase domain-containing protein [Bacillota bacterium]